MKKITLLFFSSIISFLLFSQNYDEYTQIRQDGINLFNSHDCFDAYEKFDLLLNSNIAIPANNDIASWEKNV